MVRERKQLSGLLPLTLFGLLSFGTLTGQNTTTSAVLTNSNTTKPDKRPNIILIIGDDIGWNDIGCFGNPKIKTPNIDKLAGEGLRFTNAYLTASSCSPSRCSIITGRYPHNNGEAAELHGRLPYHLSLFPKVLKEAGYYTAQAGKWHLGSNKAYFTADMPAIEAFDVTGSTTGTRKDGLSGGERNWVERLRQRPGDKPFFMWFASFDAHRGWSADSAQYLNRPEDVVVPPYLADTPDTRRDLARYYNEITRLDFYIGKVMDELNRQKIAENTVIIFLSDNGRPFPRCKTRVYDSGMKTPLVIRWPDGIEQSGQRCNSLVSSIDIGPTILDLAGIIIPEDIQGVSFARLLNHPDEKTRDYTFSEHNWHDYEAHVRQMRWKNFMYIRNARPELSMIGPADAVGSPAGKDLYERLVKGNLTPAQEDYFMAPRPEEELYDCAADPEQLKNLASDPAYATVMKEMRAKMDEWQQQTGDHVPDRLTPDWFKRYDAHSDTWKVEKNQFFGLRGEYPGAAKGAAYINEKGPH